MHRATYPAAIRSLPISRRESRAAWRRHEPPSGSWYELPEGPVGTCLAARATCRRWALLPDG
jgi:hypothetical protein